MEKITREKLITSRNTWDPTKLDNVEGASDLSISHFLPIPADAIDSFYNSQHDIRATKSDSEADPAVVDKKSEGYCPKFNELKSEEYRSKP